MTANLQSSCSALTGTPALAFDIDQALERRKRILLCGVFGPYGVDDSYGRKENIMELFHNQVTKAQGIASLRFHHRSFGLYFMAENVDADVTVLDFPKKKRFIRELGRKYDIIGISFIAPNYVKAREMARLVRLHSPGSVIVLGGHGAAIEGVKDLIDCDHVVKGEGIGWMRSFLGQDPDAPVFHPELPSTERQSIFGVPVPGPTASILVPGVGCVNGCKFCCTSHFFGKNYTSFIETGGDLFETARRVSDKRKTNAFFVMDENFLKKRGRAMDLLAEMKKHKKYFNFHIFSSAETIREFGVENLVRLGVTFVWIGFESKNQEHLFAKNKGIDAQGLVRKLRDHGISVLGSGILCMEHHTPDNVQEDIDYIVGLECDLTQFMLYTPLPVTSLYEEHKARGLLRTDLLYEEWHGQKMLTWRHPAFNGDEPEQLIRDAFRRDFEVNSSSMYRMVETAFRGYRTLNAISDRDDCIEVRTRQIEKRVRDYRTILPVIAAHSVNGKERAKALALEAEIDAALGPPNAAQRTASLVSKLFAWRWSLRMRFRGDVLQPATIVTRYHNSNHK